MRTHSRIIAAVSTLALVVLAVAPRAEAGQRWERAKRSPAAVGAMAAAGTVAVLHPVATASAIVGTGAFAGGVALGAAKLGGGLLVGGGHALLAATAVSPLAGLLFAGATVYAGVKGGKWVMNKWRERKAARQGQQLMQPSAPRYAEPDPGPDPLRANLGGPQMAGAY